MDTRAPAAEDLDRLRLLAERNGVATHFWDWYGQRRDVSASSLLAVLHALGVPVDADATVGDVEAALTWTEDEPWRRTLPECTVVRAGRSAHISVHVPDGDWVAVTCVREDGVREELGQVDHWVPPRWVDGALTGRATFEVPGHLPLGWHRLVATVEDGSVHSAPLIVVPERLEVPSLADGRRHWGVAAQFYSVRSSHSWGIGDTADLADLAAVCASKGADFVLINPVHASSPVAPMENSPYLPVTRRWINPLYIHPESIPEFTGAPTAMREAVEELRLTTVIDEAGGRIDRDRSWEAKRKALELVHTLARRPHREAAFRAFIAEGGADLADFALWCALVEAGDQADFAEGTALGSTSDERRLELADRIEFWQWCQWVAREQFVEVQRVAVDLGMDFGIMADLAVGVHPHGSEPWSEPEMFAQGITVGAPPDMYSQQGQNWSQPPWSPRALARSGYRPLRDMLRAVLAHAGAVRLDHVLGLFRLWWIPQGRAAGEGTYVHFDHEAMVGVLLLEAQRAGAALIGEDLGTVEPWVRDHLASRGILGTSVVWFEKEESGWPLHAGQYRRDVLATVNTHDLPPTAGYLEGVHTTLRDRLGLLVDDVEKVREADRVELERMMVRLREYGFLTSAEPSAQELIEALHRYVAATPSRLVGISLVDAVGDKRPQNLPGTYLEYPNWCIPLCDPEGAEVHVEALASNERFRSLAALVDHALS